MRSQAPPLSASGGFRLGVLGGVLHYLFSRCAGFAGAGDGLCRGVYAPPGHDFLHGIASKDFASASDWDSDRDRHWSHRGAVSAGGSDLRSDRRQGGTLRISRGRARTPIWDDGASKLADRIFGRCVDHHFDLHDTRARAGRPGGGECVGNRGSGDGGALGT